MGTFSNLQKVKLKPWFIVPVDLGTGKIGKPRKAQGDAYEAKFVDILVTDAAPRFYIRAEDAAEASRHARRQVGIYLAVRPVKVKAA
jgi:hypothetical protein